MLAQPPLLYEEGNTQTCNSFTPSSKAPKLLYGRLCGRDVTSPALMLLDLNGEVRSSAPRPDGVEPLSHTYRKVGDGWIAWDAYRDEEPYRVAWSLPAGKRLHRVLKGRSINSVAVTPSADLIAISVASRLNIGRIEDAVYVLRASDGAEVFRQYLPLYTRTQVLFPTNETLLYSTGEKTLLVRIVR